jgi:outer membrane receptor protein involved in Fe transport
MNRIVPLLLFLFIGSGIWAQTPQTPTARGKGKIIGKVIDSSSKGPVEFATISLVDLATNKTVDGAVCDDQGKFDMTKLANGQYKLTVVFFGYKNKDILVEISDSKTDVNLGTIALSSSVQQLQEVTVEGKKELVEEKVDRVIYNAENDATNRGGDATDVLRKAPMLSVDLDGNVSLRGSQNVKVLINNKPSTITAGSIADALKQIPADQIKSVEVITSPSAKYDAEGSAGIINIITKKSNLEGFSLGVDGSVGIRGSNLGLNGSYRKGKMGFSLGGHGRLGYNIPGEFDNRQTTKNADGSTITNTQHAHTQNVMAFGQYSLGWDYDINKNNSLTASLKYSLRDMITTQNNLLTQNFRNDTLQSYNTRNVKTTDLSNTVDASLTYTHTFKKPQREFSLMSLFSRNNRTNDFTSSILDNADLSTIANRYQNKNKSYNQEITLQADYQTPVAKNQMLEMGVKNIRRNVNSEYQYLYAVGADGPFLPTSNSNLSNTFNYTQNISAAYTSFTLNFLKTFTAKVGARYEYTIIDAHFQNQQNSPTDIPSYGVLVPSINVSKKLKTGMIKASFNRRIQRPSLQFLNPNIQASNPLNISMGNPYLNPEYTNNYELSYSRYLKGSSITLATFMRNTTGAIQSVRHTKGDTIVTTYQNIGSEDAYGFNLFASISISKKFTLNGGADVYYAVLKNNVPDPLYNASNEGWVASYRANASYDLTKGWGVQLFGFYRARQVQLQGYQGGFGIYSLSIKKDFNEKKGSIGFGAENFFTPSFHIPTEVNSPVVTQHSVNTLHNMNFKINFSYRIGKMTTGEERKKRKKSVNNDDLKEGGDNNSSGGGFSPMGGGTGGNNPSGPSESGQKPAGNMNPGGNKPAGAAPGAK